MSCAILGKGLLPWHPWLCFHPHFVHFNIEIALLNVLELSYRPKLYMIWRIYNNIYVDMMFNKEM
jgi:hypothetical protein